MERITVPFITGDGVGAEITPSMQAVVNAALEKLIRASGVSNGKKSWQENVRSTQRVPGCPTKRWKRFANIK